MLLGVGGRGVVRARATTATRVTRENRGALGFLRGLSAQGQEPRGRCGKGVRGRTFPHPGARIAANPKHD